MTTLTPLQFRALLDLWMVTDPWPLEAWQDDELVRLLDTEAQRRGFTERVEAYHRFEVSR